VALAHIDALIDKVADPALRQMLRDQVSLMLTKQSFGLVFQAHKPETVELPNYRIRRGSKVRVKTEDASALHLVESVARGMAKLIALDEAAERSVIEVEELVAVRDFGEPIYPGLLSLGKIARGGDKPSHVVINAENFHALETLRYTHEEKVDVIYIDPPYNSGAKDWKYNNDYVDGVDRYRHSKWLAMMKRRLDLAKHLLNPADSVLIVTIDEKECVRLGMLLEQIFDDAKIQMVTTVISAKGTMRKREFSRVAEHIFVVLIGAAAVVPWGPNMLDEGVTEEPGESVQWLLLRRREPTSTRLSRRGQFYPIFVNTSDGSLHSIGDAIPPEVDRHSVPVPPGAIAFWPLNSKGKEMVWGLTAPVLRKRAEVGHFRLRRWNPRKKTISIQYLPGGVVEGLESGRIELTGRDPDGAVLARYGQDVRGAIPKTVWNLPSHNAETFGTDMLSKLIPGRRFDYPKSLHAVEDTLRFFVDKKPNAVVLDFFGGSGTTAHAVARLNKLDGGRRQCILVTNNEVSDAEATALRADGHFPGDREWEALGICEYITIPRLQAAFTGRTPEGTALTDSYQFNGGFPMADGLDDNIEFFKLTYEDPDLVNLGRRFAAIASLLWLKAGGRGARIERVTEPWALCSDGYYGVLFDIDAWRGFVDAVQSRPDATHAFVVTDSEAAFQQVVAELPTSIETRQLYTDYLHSFTINMADV
jgi:adenine-specific DNA-methyltransferase